MTLNNSCYIGTSRSNLTFPITVDLKVGGRFRFDNSSNRHYIYGYSPNISFNTYYYSDDYQGTFDIVYTKLSDEAVAITYTTYDPSDTEVPAFKTDITYPYSGGTTSSTTLTSFDVPYTYPYKVKTNDKFSADSQSYTAVQTTRTINLTLYPNNREFASVADMKAYTYAWEGMNANVGDTKYKYKNGEWAEITEEFTVDLNSQWQGSSSYGSLSSDTANYDFYESFINHNVNNGKATMFITINGYASFTFKVRNDSEGNYDYVVVNNLDDTTVPSWQPSVGSGTASSGKVYYTNKGKSSSKTWDDVAFNDLDGGEHIITVTYGKDGSANVGDDRGYVAIPKKQ